MLPFFFVSSFIFFRKNVKYVLKCLCVNRKMRTFVNVKHSDVCHIDLI